MIEYGYETITFMESIIGACRRVLWNLVCRIWQHTRRHGRFPRLYFISSWHCQFDRGTRQKRQIRTSVYYITHAHRYRGLRVLMNAGK